MVHGRRGVVVGALWCGAAAAAPVTLQHQGRLLGPGGAPLEGARDVDVALYSAQTAGTLLYEAPVTTPLDDGYYSLALTPDSSALGGAVWLEVRVDGTAIGPRTALGATPRAVVATSVVGGPVDATALSINGVPVVDGSGAWSGGSTPRVVNLTDAATITVNAANAEVFQVTLAGTRTLANPTALVHGKRYTFIFRQDATGGRGLTFGSAYRFSRSQALNSAANAYSVLEFVAVGSDLVHVGGNTSTCAPGSTTLVATGADQSFTVPNGCSVIRVKLWGAGGGGGALTTGTGGGGGFATADLDVIPNEALTIIVGAGGHSTQVAPVGAYGGGGRGDGNLSGYGGGGGGRSAVRRGTIELITAGGGGGAQWADPGGAGGGLVGIAGSTPNYYLTDTAKGGGGTETAGGAAGCGAQSCSTAGSQYTGGGNGNVYTAGGGGGWYGGGGGGSVSSSHDGGGGGSSKVPVGGITTSGSGRTPGNNTDTNYPSGVGLGGLTANPGAGGAVFIQWGF
jgi:hypothetical protein